jgi:hypothetical protein
MEESVQDSKRVPTDPSTQDAEGAREPAAARESHGGHVPPDTPRSYTAHQDMHAANNSRGMQFDRQTSRHAASRSKARRIRKLTVLVVLLLVALVGVSMGWILAWAKLRLIESENLTLDVSLRQTSEELQALKARVLERDTALQAMVEKRIPGLAPLEYNKLMDVNDKYVLSVTFAESGVADSKAIEYHALLRNDTDAIVSPHVKIFLFDELGVQAGAVELKKRDATGDVDIAELRPGETRSYNAKIDVDRHATPKFFLIQVD